MDHTSRFFQDLIHHNPINSQPTLLLRDRPEWHHGEIECFKLGGAIKALCPLAFCVDVCFLDGGVAVSCEDEEKLWQFYCWLETLVPSIFVSTPWHGFQPISCLSPWVEGYLVSPIINR